MKLRWLFAFILTWCFSTVLKAQAPNFCSGKSPSLTYNLTNVHDITIHDVTIGNAGFIGIHLTKCYNIHIVRVQIKGNNTNYGIRIDNSHDIKVDTVSIQDNAFGVYAANCTGNIQITNNQTYHIQGIAIGSTKAGHAFQLSACTGAGNMINNNNTDNPVGTGSNPRNLVGDLISIYGSTGTPASPIQVHFNNLRNGGTDLITLAAGVVVGDNNGGYTDVRGNVLVNSGFAGITSAGGTNQVIIGNTIYGANNPWTAVGLTSANFSGGISNSTISNNIVNWFSGISHHQRDTSYKGKNNTIPIGWFTNKVNQPIGPNILPVVLFQVCNGLSFPPIPTQIYGALPFYPSATSSNPITFTSSNSAVATIVSGQIVIHAAGTSTIVASDGISSIPQTLSVSKAPLQIFADFKTKTQGSPNPTLTATIAGFKYADHTSVFLTPLVLSTTAVTGSPNGIYPIVAGGASASNYNITFFNNFLVVGSVIQTGFTVAQPSHVIFQGH